MLLSLSLSLSLYVCLLRQLNSGQVYLILQDSMSNIVTHHKRDRNPLDKGSASRRDLYPTTQNTHKQQISIPPAGFEPATPASDRPQTLTLDLSATVLLCPDCAGCAFCPLLYNTQENTNIHSPSGIRTRNPNNRAAVDPRLRPIGHWDRRRNVATD